MEENRVKKMMSDNLKIYYKRSGLERGEFAKRIGFTEQGVSKWLKDNACSPPDVANLDKIADALGVTVKDFFEERPAPMHPADKMELKRIETMIRDQPDAKWIVTHMLEYSKTELFAFRQIVEGMEDLRKTHKKK
ncbi:MAG: helix-turn-helix transcriptional regulator [Abditibacteriota bacterium]|nr:helix-turn-helix transcriptional regulator [Abditibacteriota bacterium]